MSSVSSKVGSYHDFQGLGELRGQAQRRDGTALREVAQQFEAMFIQQIMKTMREAGFKGADMFDSQALDTFQSMHDKEISLHMSKRGSFGLADMLVKSMERQEQAIPAAQLMQDGARLHAESGRGLPLSSEQKALPVSKPARNFLLEREAGGAIPLKQGLPLSPARTIAAPGGSDGR